MPENPRIIMSVASFCTLDVDIFSNI